MQSKWEHLLLRFFTPPQAAIDYGIRDATGMFKGIPGINEVTTILHLCCGYPNYLDQKDYMKADKKNYVRIAELLDNSGISQVVSSILHFERSESKFPAQLHKSLFSPRFQLRTAKLAMTLGNCCPASKTSL